jgi:chorismate mutase / prephenate dehydratase
MDDMAPPPAPERDPLAPLRAEIDGIDQTLLALIGQRMLLADKIVKAKGETTGLPIRSGREIQMLRKLVATAPQAVEPELVVELWRALIAANLRRQTVIDVAVGGGRNDPSRLFDIARRHFGARTRISHVGEPQTALLRAVENPNTVAVCPWPAAPGVGSWWPALSESRFHRLHLIAGLPVSGPVDAEPEACIFAAAPTEPAGGDISLVMVEDPHHRLQRALGESGLQGKEVARSEPRALIRIDEFLAINDPRATALSGSGLDRVRVLGSYARV